MKLSVLVFSLLIQEHTLTPEGREEKPVFWGLLISPHSNTKREHRSCLVLHGGRGGVRNFMLSYPFWAEDN